MTQTPVIMPRALVVDDEPQMRALVGRALVNEQIVCDFAEDGAAARKKLDETPYDIVVTDLRMPNVNGHVLCQSLLGSADRPLLIAMTGVVDPRLGRDLRARGIDAIFEKPLDFLVFGKQIRAMIDNHTRCTAAVVVENPSREHASAGDQSLSEPARKSTVAILMQQQRRARQLAAQLGTPAVKVFVAETTDALCGFIDAQLVDLLLSATEVLSRLQGSPSPPEVVVIGDCEDLKADQIRSLKVRKVFGADATDSDLVHAIRSALINSERARMTSPEARALAKSFGVPPHSTAILLKLTQYLGMPQGELPISELARDIMADAATTAELLRLANGSSLGKRRQTTSVADGLKYFGPGRAVALLLSSSIRNVERGLFRGFSAALREWYQRRTVLIAAFASVFAERHFGLSGDMAFILGLFQDMGILVLAEAFGDRYLKVLQHARDVGPVRLHAIEQQYLHVNHAEVSAALVEMWQLPEKLVRPIRDHHQAAEFTVTSHGSKSYVQPMRIGEGFADLWDNRHPARRDALSTFLSSPDCSRDADFQESLALAVRRSSEFAGLFQLPTPDAVVALEVCREVLSHYAVA